jgi:hypothetical protein
MSDTPGWDAIEAHLQPVNPGQEPKHWGTVMRYGEGGPDIFPGFGIYPLICLQYVGSGGQGVLPRGC